METPYVPLADYIELKKKLDGEENKTQQLDKLLFAVGRKFPGETRFETALRYIREAEKVADSGAAKMVVPNNQGKQPATMNPTKDENNG